MIMITLSNSCSFRYGFIWLWFLWISFVFVCYCLASWAFHLSGCMWFLETTFRRVNNPRSFGQLLLRFWLVGQPRFFSNETMTVLLKVLVGDITWAHIFVFLSRVIYIPSLEKNWSTYSKFGVKSVCLIVCHVFFIKWFLRLVESGGVYDWMSVFPKLEVGFIPWKTLKTEVVISWTWSSGNPCRRHWWTVKMKTENEGCSPGIL